MAPALVVLQLDTRFPRVPGDIACPETYLLPMHTEIIPKAQVAKVATGSSFRSFARFPSSREKSLFVRDLRSL